MLLSKFAVCNGKKSEFGKQQQISWVNFFTRSCFVLNV